MTESQRVNRLDGTPGWKIGRGDVPGELEFAITLDDQNVVSSPMRRQDALDLSELLKEAVRRLDEGSLDPLN